MNRRADSRLHFLRNLSSRLKINDNPYRASALERPETFFSKPQLDQLAGLRRITQVIVGALIVGMILFLLVSSVVGGDLASLSFDLDLNQFITIGAVGCAVVRIIASQVVTKFIYKKTPMSCEAPTDQEIQSAQMQYQTELIIRSALPESAGFSV